MNEIPWSEAGRDELELINLASFDVPTNQNCFYTIKENIKRVGR